MNLFLLIVAIVLVAYFLCKTIFTRHKYFPPGPSVWIPFFGNYLTLLLINYQHTHQGFDKLSKFYKTKILGFYLGSVPTVVVSDQKSVKELLMRPEFQGRMDQITTLVRVDFEEEKGIIFTEGDLWQQQKRFFLRHLRDYGFGKRSETLEMELVEEVQSLVTFLKEEKNHHLYRNGQVLIPSVFPWANINLLMKALTGERFMGTKGREILEKIHSDTLNFQFHLEPCASALTFLPFAKYIPPFRGHYKHIVELNESLASYAKDSISRRIEQFQEDQINCAVDVYIKEMKDSQQNDDIETYFTEKQLKLIIQDFMFPASNTISGQLGFLWQQFLIHPEVQTKIQEEIDRVIGRKVQPNLNHRKDMHYTEATIREIMRYKTLVPLSVPHRSTQDAEFMGYFIRKGTIMITNLFSLHSDKELWGDPENFRPERFLDDKGHLMKKDNTLPFGLGKRLCPGETFARQNMFMFVTGLLQQFTFTLPPDSKLPDVLDYYPGLNVHPKHFWATVTLRG